MNKPVRNIFVMMIGIAVVFISGCAEQKPPTFKESRAIAAENIALNKKVEQLKSQIDELKKLHEEQMKQQEDALAKCTEEKESWKQKAEQNIRDQVKGVLDAVVDDNARLREENKQLKAQLEKFRIESEKPEESTQNKNMEIPKESAEQ